MMVKAKGNWNTGITTRKLLANWACEHSILPIFQGIHHTDQRGGSKPTVLGSRFSSAAERPACCVSVAGNRPQPSQSRPCPSRSLPVAYPPSQDQDHRSGQEGGDDRNLLPFHKAPDRQSIPRKGPPHPHVGFDQSIAMVEHHAIQVLVFSVEPVDKIGRRHFSFSALEFAEFQLMSGHGALFRRWMSWTLSLTPVLSWFALPLQAACSIQFPSNSEFLLSALSSLSYLCHERTIHTTPFSSTTFPLPLRISLKTDAKASLRTRWSYHRKLSNTGIKSKVPHTNWKPKFSI